MDANSAELTVIYAGSDYREQGERAGLVMDVIEAVLERKRAPQFVQVGEFSLWVTPTTDIAVRYDGGL